MGDFGKGSSLVAQTVKCLSTMLEMQVQSLGREDSLEKEMVIHSSTIAWKSHGQRNLVGYSPWGCKELDVTKWLHFHFHGRFYIKFELSWGILWWWYCLVIKLCPALCSPMDCSLPGSSVHGIFQARILE